jgi:hypothetical protein
MTDPKLVSITLALDTYRPDLIGTLMFISVDAGSSGDVVEVNVGVVEQRPGWQLTDMNGAVLEDPADPITREADRLMRVLLIPADEVARRESAVRAVIHSGYLDGAAGNDVWETAMFRFARGEITDDELTRVSHTVTGTPDPVDGPAVPDPAVLPAAWWEATERRHRQWLLDLTVTTDDAAEMLGFTTQDLDYTLGIRGLIDLDLDGEPRIPRWQLHQSTDSDRGGRYSLLPGLGIVLAAAPERLQDPEQLTRFMTTPHPYLQVDAVAVTPAEWLAGGQVLRSVVAALQGRRW